MRPVPRHLSPPDFNTALTGSVMYGAIPEAPHGIYFLPRRFHVESSSVCAGTAPHVAQDHFGDSF